MNKSDSVLDLLLFASLRALLPTLAHQHIWRNCLIQCFAVVGGKSGKLALRCNLGGVNLQQTCRRRTVL